MLHACAGFSVLIALQCATVCDSRRALLRVCVCARVRTGVQAATQQLPTKAAESDEDGDDAIELTVQPPSIRRALSIMPKGKKKKRQ